jgi:hypothetical protein
MDIEISAEARNKALNRKVAITVIALSVFLGLTKIKDDNLVQAMQQAKADAVDTWGEYQATKTKLNLVETALGQTRLLASVARSGAGQAEIARLNADVARYRREAPDLAAKARGFEARYGALNVHDDQFDACDALVSIAVSAAAVAALTESAAVLTVAWVLGGLGAVMGLAGIFGWALHPAWLSALLG